MILFVVEILEPDTETALRTKTYTTALAWSTDSKTDEIAYVTYMFSKTWLKHTMHLTSASYTKTKQFREISAFGHCWFISGIVMIQR